jgi:hypothetical protein
MKRKKESLQNGAVTAKQTTDRRFSFFFFNLNFNEDYCAFTILISLWFFLRLCVETNDGM